MQNYLLGIIISICGNVLISISLNIQKYAHVRQAQRGSKPYYTSAMWWCGVVLMGIGELGNFAAYGFAPASLIAPLGCVSVIGQKSLIASFIFFLRTETIKVWFFSVQIEQPQDLVTLFSLFVDAFT
ncbi:hypothetical protein AMECASPLE_022581 [Ameca splendens]|uniref:Magnesium transporter n=1 Tax=Ameca splendens TaxID=208324 RepID=A0ABV0ZZG3_9TELE